MNLIKNTATNAAELYKQLSNGRMVYHKRLGPVHVNKMELLTNPASTSVTCYTHDGSDYGIYISEIRGFINCSLN
jgi:hypothetical protein